MSVKLVMPSNHLILCCPLLLLPSVFPSIRVFSSESALHIRWPKYLELSSAVLSHSVMSNSLQPHGLQHTRPLCPLPSPGACSNSCPMSWWCHPTICCPLLLLPSIFLSIRVFSNKSALCIRWPKYWSFSSSISPSSEYSGLISFRIDWSDLFAVQGALKGLL